MMEFPKIETLYERDDATHKVTNNIRNRTYELIKTWHWTEKIDGTNVRVIWKDDRLVFKGRSDNAQLSTKLYTRLQELMIPERFKEVFPGGDAILYGEGYGAGIQRGGDYSPTQEFILFDVLVDGKWWLSYENVCDVAEKLGLDVVPSFGLMTLDDATELVRKGFHSKLNFGKAMAEGLVGRPQETLFDKKGARLITKLKTKDF